MGQHTNWTITYFEGNSGVPRYLNDCALDSLTSDSLRVMSNGTYHWLHLYYIYELSRPDEKHDFTRPMWVGAFIGGITGLVTSAFIEGNSSGNVDRGNQPWPLHWFLPQWADALVLPNQLMERT